MTPVLSAVQLAQRRLADEWGITDQVLTKLAGEAAPAPTPAKPAATPAPTPAPAAPPPAPAPQPAPAAQQVPAQPQVRQPVANPGQQTLQQQQQPAAGTAAQILERGRQTIRDVMQGANYEQNRARINNVLKQQIIAIEQAGGDATPLKQEFQDQLIEQKPWWERWYAKATGAVHDWTGIGTSTRDKALAVFNDKAQATVGNVTKVLDQQGPQGVMDFISKDPAMLAIPLGMLAMLAGGKAGKLIGALALAFGGMHVYQKYQLAKDPMVSQALQLQANGGDYTKDPGFLQQLQQSIVKDNPNLAHDPAALQQAVQAKLAQIPEGIQAVSAAYKAGLFDPQKEAGEAAKEFASFLPPDPKAQTPATGAPA